MTTTAALDQIATAFANITVATDQPTVPAMVAGTRDPATITRTQTILRRPETAPADRDRIWAYVVQQARAEGHPWTVIAAGLALPGLRHAAARAARICTSEDAADSDAEILAAFVTALTEIDTTRPRICSRLCQRAFSAGRSYARRQLRSERTKQRALESRMPPPISGHVDLVLAAAVRDGVITRDNAEIIGATRFDGQSFDHLAHRRGSTAASLRQRRIATEAALVYWIKGMSIGDRSVASSQEESGRLEGFQGGEERKVR